MAVVTNLSELKAYVNILEDFHEKKYKDYELLRKDLLIEFGVRTSINHIRKLYDMQEPSAEDHAIDMQILYNNVMA